ncbi:DMT family transporter [Paenibacillus montanisoli]|uniref:EamA domain-containing protein n=1 Tax=Paenibacillus montanisoli TaxID=2081970 RepID=A0A328UCK3_9BACL|nr:DMT family transporter [Paenibacillus montanisoli]RAP78044.1 hypothetical protein DL346_06250 [Paenibacillus montanisoli]
MRTHSQWLYRLMMICGAGLLGVSATLVDYLYEAGYSIPDLTNVQYQLAVIGLWLGVFVSYRKLKRIPRRRDLLYMAVTGAAAAGGIVFYFQSLRLLPVSLAIILLFQFTWMVPIIDSIVKRKRPSMQKITGSAVILIGTVLAVGLDWPQLKEASAGAAAVGLAAAFCFAISLYVPEYMKHDSPVIVRAAITLTFSAAAVLPVFPPEYVISGVFKDGLLWWGLLLAVIGQVIPNLFMLSAIPKIGGRTAGVLGAAELPVTLLSANLILGESMSWLRWFGAAIIVIGIFCSEFRFGAWSIGSKPSESVDSPLS